jgi:hypothetical protein
MSIHHAGDAVKPEAIKHVDIHVVAEIRQEEAEHFVTAIVEQSRIPEFVTTSGTLVEIKVIGSVKHVDSDISVAGGFTYPSSMFLQACEWTTSSRTVSPSSCALSINDLRSSGVPIVSGDGGELTIAG